MTQFYVEKQIIIGHPDGWRHVLTIHDEPPIIKIEYQELRQPQDAPQLHSEWVTVATIDGLWDENAMIIGKALIELGEFISKNESLPDPPF